MVKIRFLDPLKNWEGNFLELFPFARFVSGLGWLDSDSQKNSTPSPSLPTSIMPNFWVKTNVKLHSKFVSFGRVLNVIQMGWFFQKLVSTSKGTFGRGAGSKFLKTFFFHPSTVHCTFYTRDSLHSMQASIIFQLSLYVYTIQTRLNITVHNVHIALRMKISFHMSFMVHGQCVSL